MIQKGESKTTVHFNFIPIANSGKNGNNNDNIDDNKIRRKYNKITISILSESPSTLIYSIINLMHSNVTHMYANR